MVRDLCRIQSHLAYFVHRAPIVCFIDRVGEEELGIPRRELGSYDRALVRRGDATVWVSPEAIATWEPTGGGTRSGQLKYSDLAIETALTLRLLFHLPLRQTEGLLTSAHPELLSIEVNRPV